MTYRKYDDWKTASPDDERDRYGERLLPCERKPKFDDNDICLYCGCNPYQTCGYER